MSKKDTYYLKDCPFCGQHGKLYINGSKKRNWAAIGCKSCGCYLENISLESLVAQWNLRPGEEKIRKMEKIKAILS